MTQINLDEIIINTVLKNIPKNIKPVAYLMDLLDLSRESVYRRMRKEISFSIEELTRLSLALNFSIDEITERSKNECVFFDLQSNMPINSSDAFLKMFQIYDNYLQILLKAKKSKTQVALNQLLPLLLVFCDNLFKFSYCKWINEITENPAKPYFFDLVIPPELLCLQKKVATGLMNIGNNTVILSPYIFLDAIKEIQYYYQRKLLKKEELQLLKEDILSFIDLIEKVVQNGGFNPKAKIDIYLSSLHLASNTVCLTHDDFTETHLWMYVTNPIIIRNIEVCEMQKKWFQSSKKHSTLISQSNEILQAKFFDKQREYVETYLVENSSLDFIIH
jgi:hypothetical protein